MDTQDIFDTWKLVVSKVSFNGFGNLSVSFGRLNILMNAEMFISIETWTNSMGVF